jgi:hypothetical protein
LSVGAGLFKGDRIETEDDSSLGMRFTDGSEFNLGESAAMSVDSHAYNKEHSNQHLFVQHLQGRVSIREWLHRALKVALNGRAHIGDDHRYSWHPWRR